MHIETVPTSQINPAPYNPRLDLKPGDPEYESIARSIDEHGLVEPLVWNRRTGHLVGGHQRFKVLLARGDETVQVSVVDLPLEREMTLNLALNKVGGKWDERRLAQLLDDLLDDSGIDLEATGFRLDEAEDLIGQLLTSEPGGSDEADLTPPDEADAITKPGDLIELGENRLLCGDATDALSVRRLMSGERAVLFATDPPYLVGYDGGNRPTSKQGNGTIWDRKAGNEDLYAKFIEVAIKEAIRVDAAWYHWHASVMRPVLHEAWQRTGALSHVEIILDREIGLPSRSWYHWQHEPCMMGWLQGHRPPRAERQRLTTVWRYPTPRGRQRPDHPTPKPIEVFELPMWQHTRPKTSRRRGDVCYEPFAGSGTQLIAAERLGRRCFAMELSPAYCDVIVRRFIAAFGRSSVPESVAERYADRVSGVAS
ncbi:MAG: DNA modification methylase [Phycisphaerales bacterium]|nr:DNA modification methylase [Phycisphaerales bacterium]